MQPRWYQSDLLGQTRTAWAEGAQNVLVVSPPRSGKTKMAVWLAEPFIAGNQGVCFQVHREELIRQVSMEFAEFGHEHRLLVPSDVLKYIVELQIKEFGRSFVRDNASVTVGSVQTINARVSKLTQWAAKIGLWITDEAHHLLPNNQWGKVVSLFPNAKGVGFTATPARTDRKSLCREQGGVFDVMVKGVTARQLINEGYICDYRIIAPPSSIDRDALRVGATGDFVQKGLAEATKHQSTITGDCVESYLKYVNGQQAIAFAVDIEHANAMCEAYRESGILAEAVSSKTPKHVRKMLMDKFERKKFAILVNVDLLGEGLNMEGIDVVIMARSTQSFILFVQQFFRALTKGENKHLGTIIDHAGNVGFFGRMYGLPDTYNRWTLYNEERGKRTTRDVQVTPITTCTECFTPYLAITPVCPHCGHKPEPESRSGPKFVDGDLIELDASTLAMMRGEINRIDGEVLLPHGANDMIAGAVRKRWYERQDAQSDLRHHIALWAGMWRERGADDHEVYRRFYHRFEIDIMSAQALGAKDANQLKINIEGSYND